MQMSGAGLWLTICNKYFGEDLQNKKKRNQMKGKSVLNCSISAI